MSNSFRLTLEDTTYQWKGIHSIWKENKPFNNEWNEAEEKHSYEKLKTAFFILEDCENLYLDRQVSHDMGTQDDQITLSNALNIIQKDLNKRKKGSRQAWQHMDIKLKTLLNTQLP